MSALGAVLIGTSVGLVGLEQEWRGLWRRSGASPFQSPSWLLPWWRQFGGAARVVAAALHGPEGQLWGLLPAYVLDEGGGAKLLPIGAGCSDYLDALVDPAAPPDTAAGLLACVLEGAGPIRGCDLIDLPPGAALRDAATPPGWTSRLAETSACPVLALPETMAGLETVIPANARRKLRMNRHRGARAGGWSVHRATAAAATGPLEALLRLHAARWTGKGEAAGVLADDRMGALLRDSVPRLLADDAAWLIDVRFDGAIAASCLALAGPGRLLLYMSGFDSARAYESPGTLLLGDLITAAIEGGVRELHFLRGGEAYKYGWGAADRFNATRHLAPA